MSNYDASIRISTKINTKSTEVQLATLENRIVKTSDEIVSLRSEMDSLKNTKIPTQEYEDITSDISKAEKELSKLTEKQTQMQREGKDSGVAWDRLNQKIQATNEYIEYAKSELQELIDNGKAFTVGNPEEEAKISQKLQYKEADLSSMLQKRALLLSKTRTQTQEEQRLAEIKENATVADQELVNLLERRKELIKEIADLEKAGVTEGYQEYDSALAELSDVQSQINSIREMRDGAEEVRGSYVRLGEAVKNAFSKIGKGLIDVPIAAAKKGAEGLLFVFSKLGNVVKKSVAVPFKLLGNTAKNAFAKINQHASRSGGFLSKFGSQIKNLVVSFLIFNQIRKIFSSTVNSIKEGFTNLYNDNLKFRSSVDNLKASLLTLKNALASTFAPIVETAIPYIQRLVEWMTRAADAAGQLIAALMGRKAYTKAIKQTTAALKEETKAQNKQLSTLDDLNNLTSQQDSGGDNGAGGMFEEEVPISDKWKNIADWLKDMWENSDFYELGKLLGEKLKSVLDSIPWDKIKELSGKLGKSIASLLNGFVEVEGLALSIGKTFAEVLNTAFAFLNAFVHELHWDSVGKFIAETINGFFQNIDWDLIYDTLTTAAKGLSDLVNNFTDTLDWDAISTSVSNFFNTLIDTIYIFITETDWVALAEKLGKAISDAFTGIDWAKAGQTLGEAFKAFFDFIATTIENIDWWAVGESVRDFLVNIDWAGVAESFFKAVGAALGGLAAFLGGLLANAVADAVDFFKEKVEECGGYIGLGILKGIAEALANIGSWINEHIFRPFIEEFKKAFEIHSPSKVMADMGKYIIEGLLKGLKDTWSSITEWIEDKVGWIIDKFKGIGEKIEKIKGTFSGGGTSDSSKSSAYSTASTFSTYRNPVIESLSNVEIPAYATGQVIPRTMKQHLAILGDNNSETEVVSPLSTIEQAVENVVAKLGLSGNSQEINLYLTVECEGYKLLQLMKKLDSEYFKQTGKHAMA